MQPTRRRNSPIAGAAQSSVPSNAAPTRSSNRNTVVTAAIGLTLVAGFAVVGLSLGAGSGGSSTTAAIEDGHVLVDSLSEQTTRAVKRLNRDRSTTNTKTNGEAMVGADSSPLTASCASRSNCLTCLFDAQQLKSSGGGGGGGGKSGEGTLTTSYHLNNKCAWCASSSVCMPIAAAYAGYVGGSGNKAADGDSTAEGDADSPSSQCGDIEERSCPAILHDRPPSIHRVTHVAIRKGGPEALVQLHLALNHWGYRTTLDTRQSKKQKGGEVVPFFKEAYQKEFSVAPPLRWVKDYNDWHSKASDGEVLIATETWECKKYQNLATNIDVKDAYSTASASNSNAIVEFYNPQARSGARQLQWHLTVWSRKERSECAIAGHTNYVTKTYMRQSKRALLFPFISPHILRLADEKIRSVVSNGEGGLAALKKNLVLYDSDTKLKDADLISANGIAHDTKIATGYTPAQLYDLYVQAKVAIDLRLPGGERLVYEAALFDVCIVLDASLNGGDYDDFPIPEEFRVMSAIPEGQTSGPPTAAFLADLNRAKDACISKYGSKAVMDGFAPLKHHVRRQRTAFYRHVRRYFSNSVHILTAVLTMQDATDRLVPFLLATLYQMPFATVEVVFASKQLRDAVPKAAIDRLKVNSLMAAVTFRVVLTTAAGGVGDKSSADDEADLAPKLRRTVELLAANPLPTPMTAAGGGASSVSSFSVASAARQLYTSIIPINAVTAFDGDYAHYLGSIISLSAAGAAASSAGGACSGGAVVKGAAQEAHRERLQTMNREEMSSSPSSSSSSSSSNLSPFCGGAYDYGAAVVDSVDSSVLSLFWRTSAMDKAFASMKRMLKGSDGGGDAALSMASLRGASSSSSSTAEFLFVDVPSEQSTVRKLAESDYYRMQPAAAAEGAMDSGAVVGTRRLESSSLLLGMREVLSAPTALASGGGGGGAAVGETALPSSSVVRLFLCEHELWQRLVEPADSIGVAGQGCPVRIPDAPAGPAA